MNSNIKSWIIQIVIFTCCLAIGLSLAARKPVWNDEIYSQLKSIKELSYRQIWYGFLGEGNNSPLFYSTQKLFTESIGYEVPQAWIEKNWGVDDPASRWLLRLLPVACMSGMITLIFAYCRQQFFPWGGWLSLLVSLSSYMVWIYWAEARPYALWMLLSTGQLILFLQLLESCENDQPKILLFSWANLLLSVTAVLSVLQTAVLSGILMWRRPTLARRMALCAGIPIMLAVAYYLNAPKYSFWFSDSPLQIINASIPKDRLFILFIYLTMLTGGYFLNNRGSAFWANAQDLRKSATLVGAVVMLLGLSLGLLLLMSLKSNPNHDGFSVSNRYFAFLAPLGIMATTFVLAQIVGLFRKQLRTVYFGGILLGGLLGWLLLWRCWQTFLLVRGFYHV